MEAVVQQYSGKHGGNSDSETDDACLDVSVKQTVNKKGKRPKGVQSSEAFAKKMKTVYNDEQREEYNFLTQENVIHVNGADMEEVHVAFVREPGNDLLMFFKNVESMQWLKNVFVAHVDEFMKTLFEKGHIKQEHVKTHFAPEVDATGSRLMKIENDKSFKLTCKEDVKRKLFLIKDDFKTGGVRTRMVVRDGRKCLPKEIDQLFMDSVTAKWCRLFCGLSLYKVDSIVVLMQKTHEKKKRETFVPIIRKEGKTRVLKELKSLRLFNKKKCDLLLDVFACYEQVVGTLSDSNRMVMNSLKDMYKMNTKK